MHHLDDAIGYLALALYMVGEVLSYAHPHGHAGPACRHVAEVLHEVRHLLKHLEEQRCQGAER